MNIEQYTVSVKDYIFELENVEFDVRVSLIPFWNLKSEVVKVGD